MPMPLGAPISVLPSQSHPCPGKNVIPTVSAASCLGGGGGSRAGRLGRGGGTSWQGGQVQIWPGQGTSATYTCVTLSRSLSLDLSFFCLQEGPEGTIWVSLLARTLERSQSVASLCRQGSKGQRGSFTGVLGTGSSGISFPGARQAWPRP